MLHRLLIALLLFLCFTVHSQSLYFSAGYDLMIPTGGGLNDFADKYNSQRAAILTQKMEAPSMFNGLSFMAGTALGPMILELGYSSHKGKMSASSNPVATQGGATGREINFENSMFNISIGVLSTDASSETYIVFPSMEANFYSMNFTTKLTGVNSAEQKGNVGSFTQVGLGASLMKGFGGTFIIYAKAAYYLDPFKSSFSDLYRKTSTSYNITDDEDEGSYSGFLLKAGIMLYWNCLQ